MDHHMPNYPDIEPNDENPMTTLQPEWKWDLHIGPDSKGGPSAVTIPQLRRPHFIRRFFYWLLLGWIWRPHV